jgi:hypothetical protein
MVRLKQYKEEEEEPAILHPIQWSHYIHSSIQGWVYIRVEDRIRKLRNRAFLLVESKKLDPRKIRSH